MSSSKNNKMIRKERSLLIIIIDVSPVLWGEREIERSATDKARLAAGKRPIGPATMKEALDAIYAFGGAFDCLERDSILEIIAVAGNEIAQVFPRKTQVQKVFQQGTQVGTRTLHQHLTLGVAELVTRSASKADEVAKQAVGQSSSNQASKGVADSDDTAAMAAALSLALCSVNRFLVSTGGGVSAIPDSASLWNRPHDEGVVSLLGGSESSHHLQGRGRTPWSPRILLVQASPDRTRDYNAFMNCTFAASKHNVVIDGCYLPSLQGPKRSPFLEQACDRTGGVFLAPSGAAQVGGALTEVLVSVFLAPRQARPGLQLPANNEVDFRARCFDTGESVDMAYVCNQCLSTFKIRPVGTCPTCGSEIRETEKRRKSKT